MPNIYYNKKIHADENTLVLLYFDESVTKDECGNTWTTYGSPTISTDWADAFGGKSLYLNGSSYLQKEGANLLLPQTFTLECRVKTGGSVSGYQFLFGALRDGIGADFIISIRNGKFHLESVMGTHAMNTTLSTNTVYHAALCCDSSNNYYFFVNGVLDKAGTLSSTRKNNYPLTVGACSNRNYYFTGYLDEIRISSVCRWTENFTPPTAPYELGEKIGTKSIELSEVN